MKDTDNHAEKRLWRKAKKIIVSLRELITGENAPHWQIVIATWCIVFITLGLGLWQTCTYKEASRADLRAYFSVTVGNPQLIVGQPIVYQVEYKNVGKTPAYNLGRAAGARPSTGVYKFDMDSLQAHLTRTTQTLNPGQSFAGIVKTDGPFTARDSANIASGKLKLHVFGKYIYDDKFGCEHFARFCYWYNCATHEFFMYDQYNDAD
jgi:hypothetical protein